ncbi:PDDEXK-like family protein [Spirosoma gilvum]
MSKMFNNYIGKAGQLFAMSEFLMLGWNVAIPEVDRGDDIFVVKDDNGELRRVQVKTAQAKAKLNGYRVQFSLPRLQLLNPPIQFYFFLLVRQENRWSDLFVITGQDLAVMLAERLKPGRGVKNITHSLVMNSRADKVTAGNTDFTVYRSIKNLFSKINH